MENFRKMVFRDTEVYGYTQTFMVELFNPFCPSISESCITIKRGGEEQGDKRLASLIR